MQTLEGLKIGNVRTLDVRAGFSQKFSFVVRKGNADLLAKVNEGLAIVKTTGAYDALYEKWFGVFETRAKIFDPFLRNARHEDYTRHSGRLWQSWEMPLFLFEPDRKVSLRAFAALALTVIFYLVR